MFRFLAALSATASFSKNVKLHKTIPPCCVFGDNDNGFFGKSAR
jgi:hypothetical protein